MQNVTIRLDEDLVAELDQEADDRDRSRSEYIRQILAGRHESEVTRQEYDHLHARHDRLQSEHEQLQRNHEILQAQYDQLQRDHDRVVRNLEDGQATLTEKVNQLLARLPEDVEIVPADEGRLKGAWRMIRGK